MTPFTSMRREQGFSLMELLVATGVLLLISSIFTSGMMQTVKHQQTIWNRTEMHSGVRSATELLQQEIGQAGRIALPTSTITLQTAVTVPSGTVPCVEVYGGGWSGGVTATVTVSSVAALWAGTNTGMKLTTLDGDSSETIVVQSIASASSEITACFSRSHAANVTMMPLGGFPEGIIGPSPSYTTPWSTTTGTYTNGSDANRLKLFGDINGDGNMVFVEYFCDNGDVGAAPTHNLYRNLMAYNAGAKPAVTASQILLSNVYPNPADNGTPRPCFKYQWVTINGLQYVLDVAITLTVRTQEVDRVTRQYQTETKALLNVSPRNVYNTWMMAGLGEGSRLQSTPPTVTALLP
jgi:prepilin-type N-terminal cleavage/methylation domain-containing protein